MQRRTTPPPTPVLWLERLAWHAAAGALLAVMLLLLLGTLRWLDRVAPPVGAAPPTGREERPAAGGATVAPARREPLARPPPLAPGPIRAVARDRGAAG